MKQYTIKRMLNGHSKSPLDKIVVTFNANARKEQCHGK